MCSLNRFDSRCLLLAVLTSNWDVLIISSSFSISVFRSIWQEMIVIACCRLSVSFDYQICYRVGCQVYSPFLKSKFDALHFMFQIFFTIWFHAHPSDFFLQFGFTPILKFIGLCTWYVSVLSNTYYLYHFVGFLFSLGCMSLQFICMVFIFNLFRVMHILLHLFCIKKKFIKLNNYYIF